MNIYIRKINLLLVPFILILVGFCSIYTFLHWLLLIKFHFFSIDEMIVNFGLPFALPIIPIWIWLRPKLGQLNIKDKYGDKSSFGYCMIACILIFFPTLIAQEYLDTATGKLTIIQNISEINQHEITKYYSIKNFKIDKDNIGIQNQFEVTGKYNSNFDMTIYVVCPFLSIINQEKFIPKGNNSLIVVDGYPCLNTADINVFKPTDMTSISILKDSIASSIYGVPGKNGAILIELNAKSKNKYKEFYKSKSDTIKAWLGLHYCKSISNKLSELEKEAEFKKFALESQNEFDNTNLGNFIYLERIANSSNLDNYKKAINNLNLNSIKSDTVLTAINEPYEARNGKKLLWLISISILVILIWLIMILIPKFDTSYNTSNNIPTQKKDGLEEFLEFMKPKEGFFFTPILLMMNVLIFIILVCCGFGIISFKSEDLLKFGANFRPLVIEGQYWRLLTNTFLHGGIMHLFVNMYSLILVGLFLEPILGKTRFLLVYLISGILASCASIYWYDATVSVGASGAIFGLYGAFLVLIIAKVIPKEIGNVFFSSIIIFIGYNLLIGFTASSGIDNAAHIGGLLSGMLLSFILLFT